MACHLSNRTSAAHARNAHLTSQAIVSAIAAVVYVLGQIGAAAGACDQTGITSTGARDARGPHKAVVAAGAAV